jgi:Major Facilitator Superfamily
MVAANHVRLELVASPPCEVYRPRAVNPAPRSEIAFLGQSGGRLVPITGFIAAAAVVGFATNLSMHLLNLRMQAMGLSGFEIGASVAIQALGVSFAAPVTKHIIGRFGVRAAILSGALLSSLALIAFTSLAGLATWNAVRFAFGAGLAVLFTASESLIISRADGGNRSRIVGWYATALAAGTAAGPLLVTMIGIQGSAPLLWGALLFWLATGPIVACLKPGEELAPVVRKSTFATLRFAPVAFVSAFVFGVADNGGMAMLSVYSVLSGYDYMNAVVLAVFATLGAIVLQVPLGLSASRHDPRMLLLFCGIGSILLLTLLPAIVSVKPIAFGVAFGLGGLLEGLYTVGLICVAKSYRGIGISTANGYFISMCGLGELTGPLATGLSMEYLGASGFVLSLVATLVAYVLLIAWIKQPIGTTR